MSCSFIRPSLDHAQPTDPLRRPRGPRARSAPRHTGRPAARLRALRALLHLLEGKQSRDLRQRGTRRPGHRDDALRFLGPGIHLQHRRSARRGRLAAPEPRGAASARRPQPRRRRRARRRGQNSGGSCRRNDWLAFRALTCGSFIEGIKNRTGRKRRGKGKSGRATRDPQQEIPGRPEQRSVRSENRCSSFIPRTTRS